jgi:hypothetical protein
MCFVAEKLESVQEIFVVSKFSYCLILKTEGKGYKESMQARYFLLFYLLFCMNVKSGISR